MGSKKINITKPQLEKVIKEAAQAFVNEQYGGETYGTRPRHMPKQHVKSAALHDAPEEREARAELEYLQRHYDYLNSTYGPEDSMTQETKKKIDNLMKSLEGTVDPLGRGVYESEDHIFAPNHYCAHHVAERKTGKKGVVVDHNWNETLQEVTKYDVDFGDGNNRTMRTEDLYILEASLAGEHPGHSAKCEKEEEEESEKMKESKIKKNNLKKIIREEIKGVMSDRPFDFLNVEVVSEETENAPQEEQVDEGYLDVGHGLRADKERCQKYAERKNAEYGGGTRYYYNDCMDRAGSSGGGSSPSYAPTGWAGRKSHDHMSDIGRFEEGKIKKSDLVALIREAITATIKEQEK